MKSITPERTFFIHENYIVIMTDASAEYRRLEKDKWQNLLNMLPGEIKIVQLGISKMPLHHNNLLDLTNITTLQEALSIISNADLLIGNETGLTHFSYLSGKKTIMIFGGGHYGLFFLGQNSKILK